MAHKLFNISVYSCSGYIHAFICGHINAFISGHIHVFISGHIHVFISGHMHTFISGHMHAFISAILSLSLYDIVDIYLRKYIYILDYCMRDVSDIGDLHKFIFQFGAFQIESMFPSCFYSIRALNSFQILWFRQPWQICREWVSVTTGAG